MYIVSVLCFVGGIEASLVRAGCGLDTGFRAWSDIDSTIEVMEESIRHM